MLQGKEVCGFIELITFNVHNFELNEGAVLLKESKKIFCGELQINAISFLSFLKRFLLLSVMTLQ